MKLGKCVVCDQEKMLNQFGFCSKLCFELWKAEEDLRTIDLAPNGYLDSCVAYLKSRIEELKQEVFPSGS